MTTRRPTGEKFPQYRLTITNYSDGRRTDLTDRMQAFHYRWGSRFNNEIGHVADPAGGLFTLDNKDGFFHPLSNPIVDPLPGSVVSLAARVLERGAVRTILLFRGWSLGILDADVVGTPSTVTLPVEGAFGRIQGRNSRLYAFIGSNLPSGGLINAILDNVGWSRELRDIAPGSVILHEGRAQGLTSGGNRFFDTLSRIELITQAEGGRCWDDHRGYVMFEDYDGRIANKIAWAFNEENTNRYQLHPFGDSVINSIESQSNTVEAIALREDDFLPARETLTVGALTYGPGWILPDVRAGETREMHIALDPTKATFLQSVDMPVRGRGLTDGYNLIARTGQPVRHTLFPPSIDIKGPVGARRPGVTIRIRNDSDPSLPQSQSTGTLIVNELSGVIGRTPGNLGLNLISPLEDSESILRYGLKYVDYPAGDLFVNIDQIRNRLAQIINTHKGVGDAPPLSRLDIHGHATFEPRTGQAPFPETHTWLLARVNDDAIVSGIAGIDRPTRFHIDEMEHNWDLNLGHRSIARLTRAVNQLPGPVM